MPLPSLSHPSIPSIPSIPSLKHHHLPPPPQLLASPRFAVPIKPSSIPSLLYLSSRTSRDNLRSTAFGRGKGITQQNGLGLDPFRHSNCIHSTLPAHPQQRTPSLSA